MDKQKTERILVLILLPIFALGLFYRFIGSIKQKSTPATAAVSSVEEEKIKMLEDLKSYIKKVEYKVSSLSDPLKDKFATYIASISPMIERQALKAVNPPPLAITGLVWNINRPQAIVNGKVLSVGDEIEGAKLLSVDKNGINIEYKGFEFFINKK